MQEVLIQKDGLYFVNFQFSLTSAVTVSKNIQNLTDPKKFQGETISTLLNNFNSKNTKVQTWARCTNNAFRHQILTPFWFCDIVRWAFARFITRHVAGRSLPQATFSLFRTFCCDRIATIFGIFMKYNRMMQTEIKNLHNVC